MDAQLWARIEFLVWRDGVGKRDAAYRMVSEGYFQIRDGKIWTTRPATDEDKHADAIRAAQRRHATGDKRTWDLAEQLRARYYIVNRKIRTDAELRETCHFWLRVHKENHHLGDPMAAFASALKKGVAPN